MARDNHLKEERRQGMRYNDTKREINIEALPKGIYNLKIDFDNHESRSEKIVKL